MDIVPLQLSLSHGQEDMSILCGVVVRVKMFLLVLLISLIDLIL